MPSLLDVQTIPLLQSNIAHSFGILIFSISLIGTFNNVLLLVTNIGRQELASSIMILSLCVADILFCLTSAMTFPFGIIHGRFVLGTLGCKIQYFFLVFNAVVSIMTVSSIALEQYLSIVLSKRISTRTAYGWMGLIWVIMGSLIAGPLLFNPNPDIVVLDDSHLYCTMNWGSTKPLVYGSTLFIVVLAVMFVCLILMSYISIGYHVYRISSHSKRKAALKIQHKILLKCVILTSTFLLLWLPELFHIIALVSGSRSYSMEWSLFSAVCLVLNATLNPVLFYILDPRVQHNIKNALENIRVLFGFGIRDTVTLHVPDQKLTVVQDATKIQSTVFASITQKCSDTTK